jgi:hypothetical protein
VTDRFETDIRRALDARAHEIEVPPSLAAQTLEAARGAGERPSLRARAGTWRDARRMRFPVTGYPRWVYVAGAVGMAATLFIVGMFVSAPRDDVADVARGRDRRSSMDGEQRRQPGAKLRRAQSGNPQSGSAISGEVAGVVSGGDASVDATNRSSDVDIASGDASGANSFVGLSAGTSSTQAQAKSSKKDADGPFLEPKLVRSAEVRVAVRDFDRGWRDANDIASRYNGDIVDSKTTQAGDRIARGTVVMRIPALKLDAALDALRDLGTLARLDTSGDDIAEQLGDVKERVSEARTEEEQLLDLERRASTVSEQLEVRRRLEEHRKNLDSLKTKQKSFEDQIDFATVSATIYEDSSVDTNDGIVANAFETSSRIALTMFAGILVVIGAVLPLAVLALAVWVVARTIRRRRAVD